MDHTHDQTQKHDSGPCDKPPGPPKWRLDCDRESAARLIPQAIFIASYHLESVSPRWQTGVTRHAGVANFGPRRLQSVQSIFETRSLRRRQVQARILNLKPFLSRRDLDDLRW